MSSVDPAKKKKHPLKSLRKVIQTTINKATQSKTTITASPAQSTSSFRQQQQQQQQTSIQRQRVSPHQSDPTSFSYSSSRMETSSIQRENREIQLPMNSGSISSSSVPEQGKETWAAKLFSGQDQPTDVSQENREEVASPQEGLQKQFQTELSQVPSDEKPFFQENQGSPNDYRFSETERRESMAKQNQEDDFAGSREESQFVDVPLSQESQKEQRENQDEGKVRSDRSFSQDNVPSSSSSSSSSSSDFPSAPVDSSYFSPNVGTEIQEGDLGGFEFRQPTESVPVPFKEDPLQAGMADVKSAQHEAKDKEDQIAQPKEQLDDNNQVDKEEEEEEKDLKEEVSPEEEEAMRTLLESYDKRMQNEQEVIVAIAKDEGLIPENPLDWRNRDDDVDADENLEPKEEEGARLLSTSPVKHQQDNQQQQKEGQWRENEDKLDRKAESPIKQQQEEEDQLQPLQREWQEEVKPQPATQKPQQQQPQMEQKKNKKNKKNKQQKQKKERLPKENRQKSPLPGDASEWLDDILPSIEKEKEKENETKTLQYKKDQPLRENRENEQEKQQMGGEEGEEKLRLHNLQLGQEAHQAHLDALAEVEKQLQWIQQKSPAHLPLENKKSNKNNNNRNRNNNNKNKNKNAHLQPLLKDRLLHKQYQVLHLQEQQQQRQQQQQQQQQQREQRQQKPRFAAPPVLSRSFAEVVATTPVPGESGQLSGPDQIQHVGPSTDQKQKQQKQQQQLREVKQPELSVAQEETPKKAQRQPKAQQPKKSRRVRKHRRQSQQQEGQWQLQEEEEEQQPQQQQQQQTDGFDDSLWLQLLNSPNTFLLDDESDELAPQKDQEKGVGESEGEFARPKQRPWQLKMHLKPPQPKEQQEMPESKAQPARAGEGEAEGEEKGKEEEEGEQRWEGGIREPLDRLASQMARPSPSVAKWAASFLQWPSFLHWPSFLRLRRQRTPEALTGPGPQERPARTRTSLASRQQGRVQRLRGWATQRAGQLLNLAMFLAVLGLLTWIYATWQSFLAPFRVFFWTMRPFFWVGRKVLGWVPIPARLRELWRKSVAQPLDSLRSWELAWQKKLGISDLNPQHFVERRMRGLSFFLL